MTTSAKDTPIVVIGAGFFAAAFAAALESRGRAAVAIDCGQRHDAVPAALPACPATIVIDLLQARCDDFALLRALRQTPAYATVPVFVLSSGTVMGDDVAMIERQLRAFDAEPLLDPLEFDTVLARVAPTSFTAA